MVKIKRTPPEVKISSHDQQVWKTIKMAGNKELLLRILNGLHVRTHNILSVNIDWIREDMTQ